MASRPEVSNHSQAERQAACEASDEMRVVEDLAEYLKKYARERPQTMALICLGVGWEEALARIAAARGMKVPDTEAQRDWISRFRAPSA